MRGHFSFAFSIDTNYILRNGLHHTGDIDRFDEDGYLWYVKRKAEKELIKSGGENVYPGEVETVIQKHPQIEECCVFGVPDKTWGEVVKAVCVLSNDSKLTPKSRQSNLRVTPECPRKRL